jgi:small subunit ribosomal protein S20
LRQSKRRQERNKGNKTRLKTQLKKVRTAAEAGQYSEVKKLLPETYSLIDKSVKKGIIRKNTASRYKSRLTKLATSA